MALSISSSHNTTGAMLSAVDNARRMLSSLLPTRLPNMRPTSNRNSGIFHRPLTALAHMLLPQPCTPSSSTPLGGGRP